MTSASHLLLALPLIGQNRYQEALSHAEIADRVLAKAVSPGQKQSSSEAHQILQDVQSKLAQSNSKLAQK
ncbi:MAG: hypothetical protein ACYCPO_14280 [Acidobacteriaceae bacterium]